MTATRTVSAADMRRWAQSALNERRRRAERQLAKDWKRTTPEKAARVVEVGEALLALLKELEVNGDRHAIVCDAPEREPKPPGKIVRLPRREVTS